MKKTTLKLLLGITLLFSVMSNAQCLASIEGLYPSATSTASSCNGIAVTTITTLGYASEYSNVNVTAGETYTFSSSLATDYVTISDDDGATAAAFGTTPVTWIALNTGVVRFYTHTDDLCGGSQDFRTRSYVCGIPPCIQPIVAFSTGDLDCVNSTFNVTADITDFGSASSITVTDDQGNSPQSVSSPGTVTFGPYAFGTAVVLTATNDQTPICSVVSPSETLLGCPPTNDLCTDAIAISCGDVLTNQTTQGATGGTATSCVGTIGDDIWYTFLGDGQIFTLTATPSNGEGAQVEVYESTDGTCSGFTPGSCYASAGTGEAITSVIFSTTVGTTYYAHIGSWINGDPALLFDLSITCQTPPTPPDNDECSAAFAVSVNPDASCVAVTSGTVFGATASGIDATACGGTPDDDVWFSFVATETAQSINLNNVVGVTTDLVYSLWSGDCSSLTLVPGSCSNNTQTGLTVGETYYIRVYTFTSTALQNTTFDVCVGTLPPAPDNDLCDNALALTVGNSVTAFPLVGSTVSALPTAGLTFACQNNRTNDVWYSVEAPASGLLTVETNATSGTLMTDSVLSVFSGTCGALTEIGCDDDTGNGNFSRVVLTGLTPGDVLYIGIWRYGTSADGEFQISAYDTTLATSGFENATFSYYPNPVRDILNLSYNKNITNVTVFNLLGQEVITKPVNSNLSNIDMSHLSKGAYMVKVTADNQIKTIKVVKD